MHARTRRAGLAICALLALSSAGMADRALARSRMAVGLNAGNFGMRGVADVKHAVRLVRLEHSVGVGAVRAYANSGVKVDLLFSGPYTSAGVGAVNPQAWVANALGFYGAACTPRKCPYVEVLNEPYWRVWWGSNAASQANADAYARLLKAAHDAFHARYGSSAPKILAACENQGWNNHWCTEWRRSRAVPNPARYADYVTVHPYGGTGSRASSARGMRAMVRTAHRVSRKPVFVTEVGWPTATGCGPTGDSLQWSEAQQARNLTGFMNWARRTGYVAAVTYFNYRDFGGCTWYGVVRTNGTHKPAYNALKREAAR